jgi:hypothetical protein
MVAATPTAWPASRSLRPQLTIQQAIAELHKLRRRAVRPPGGVAVLARVVADTAVAQPSQ